MTETILETIPETISMRSPSSEPLRFDATIDRALVHRAAVSEVFLTDVRSAGPDAVLIAAQSPRCHAYFHDRLHLDRRPDPTLLMEIARQATLAGAHTVGVPRGTILISDEFALRIEDVPTPFDADATLDLTLETRFEWSAHRGGVPRAGRCRLTFSRAGRPLATYRSGGRLMRRDRLSGLREAQRGAPPPSTADMAARDEACVLAPALVGRRRPENVVLSHLEEGGSLDGPILRARIAPPWNNRALFDHAYDHLTMQLLTEAALQSAHIAQGVGESGSERAFNAVEARFLRFAEIDAPAFVALRHASSGIGYDAVIEQSGETIARLALRLSPAATTARNEGDAP